MADGRGGVRWTEGRAAKRNDSASDRKTERDPFNGRENAKKFFLRWGRRGGSRHKKFVSKTLTRTIFLRKGTPSKRRKVTVGALGEVGKKGAPWGGGEALEERSNNNEREGRKKISFPATGQHRKKQIT